MRERTRVFTLEQANGALPLVRRVARDLVEAHRRISELYGRWRALVDAGDHAGATAVDGDIRRLLAATDEYQGELEQIGCECREIQRGLVRFPARFADRIIYLCWRLDDEEIGSWHDAGDASIGRRPIDDRFTAAARQIPAPPLPTGKR